MTEKTRLHSLVIYGEGWQEILEEAEHYAYIYHDKDEAEPHYHLLIKFENPRSPQALRKKLKALTGQNVLDKPIQSKPGAYKYLTHEERADKELYEESRITTDDQEYWLQVQEKPKAYMILKALEENESLWKLVEDFGRDAVVNYSKYKEYLKAIKGQEVEEQYRNQNEEIAKAISQEEYSFNFPGTNKVIKGQIQAMSTETGLSPIWITKRLVENESLTETERRLYLTYIKQEKEKQK